MKRFASICGRTCVIPAVGLYLFAFLAAPAGAVTVFDKDTKFDIYYVVSDFEVDQARGVKISDVIELQDFFFLVIHSTGSLREEKGYIRLDTIKAILPSILKPTRTFQESGS